MLEVVARVPYQAWENVGYVAITHTYALPRLARRVFEFVEESRHQQDNEQWHLLVLAELIGRRGLEQGVFRFRLVPQLLAFFYYHLSWIVYVLRPSWSYRLNAEFEDHAEHSYMEYVAANPELEDGLRRPSFGRTTAPSTPWPTCCAASRSTSASTRRRASRGSRHPASA